MIGKVATALALGLTVVGVGLTLAPTSQAGNPYRFKNRALLERRTAVEFVKLARRTAHVRYRVRSIGCAKAGVGRIICAIVADSRDGTGRFALTLSCPSDAGIHCTVGYNEWPD